MPAAATPSSDSAPAPAADDSAWPDEIRGLKLGTTLARFLRVAHKPQHAVTAAELRRLGVPVDAARGDWKRYLWEHVAVEALRSYSALHGHFLVPAAFQVPHGDARWPRQTWGYKLGYWVVELRRSRSRLEDYQLHDLHALGFAWSAREARWNQVFVPAMTRFAELFGAHASVPQAFVVPSDDERWPKELHGFRLGQKVNNLRCGGERTVRPTASAVSGDGEMEWDDVDLVCNNWFLLDLLHEEVDAAGAATTEDGEAAPADAARKSVRSRADRQAMKERRRQ